MLTHPNKLSLPEICFMITWTDNFTFNRARIYCHVFRARTDNLTFNRTRIYCHVFRARIHRRKLLLNLDLEVLHGQVTLQYLVIYVLHFGLCQFNIISLNLCMITNESWKCEMGSYRTSHNAGWHTVWGSNQYIPHSLSSLWNTLVY